jgi:Lysyl oxidase
MKTYPLGVLLLTACGFLAVPALAAEELLPNLEALPPAEMCLTTASGNTWLHFSTTSWNSGTGPLELVAGKPDRKAKKQKVYQRIYSSDGSARDVLVGFFVWHQAHNHFHFEDYAHYILQPVNAPGASARTATKTTFCVMDTTKIDPLADAAVYTTCGKSIQGMSVGWGDTYGYYLEGQAIDVTGLPDGDYRLEIVIDPKNRLLESEQADNTSEGMIHLSEVPVCP